jgi:hypothetical protein
MPRELCKQEALTVGVCNWGSCVSEGFTYKGMKRFEMKGKLASHYIGPFPILGKCESVTYKLELSPSLAGVHDIFHVL